MYRGGEGGDSLCTLQHILHRLIREVTTAHDLLKGTVRGTVGYYQDTIVDLTPDRGARESIEPCSDDQLKGRGNDKLIFRNRRAMYSRADGLVRDS